MDPIWTRSQFTRTELEGKTIEFRLPAEDAFIRGVAELLVRQNPQGLLAIELRTFEPGRAQGEKLIVDRPLQQSEVDRIVLHPDQSIAAFLLQ